jgi:hypothetical protein
MGKQSRNTRENLFDPQTQGSLTRLYSEIKQAAEQNADRANHQHGMTTIDSVRSTHEVLGPTLSKQERAFVQVALEQTGLMVYSTFKPTTDEARNRAFRNAIQRSPLEYLIAGVQADDGNLSLMDVVVGANAEVPAHQRIHHAYIDVNTFNHTEGIIKSTTLRTTQYQARSMPPVIELNTSYTTFEEAQYNDMIEKQLVDSPETTATIVSSPLGPQLTSQNPLIRAYAESVQAGRSNTSMAHDLGVLRPSPMDIEELRESVARLFNS